ncbi:hypothetical protein DFH08DRAFT_797411 [Mycena albidolilacea]|uniref:Uncharacterized protein n=1 Tax=Mycena albidolilacea TaxID=1033008 RepID=A0AAD7AR06_9AGAR|nr:hypothetical protein DFH08DRAFT_797411 [Mycena albidolilacea]
MFIPFCSFLLVLLLLCSSLPPLIKTWFPSHLVVRNPMLKSLQAFSIPLLLLLVKLPPLLFPPQLRAASEKSSYHPILLAGLAIVTKPIPTGPHADHIVPSAGLHLSCKHPLSEADGDSHSTTHPQLNHLIQVPQLPPQRCNFTLLILRPIPVNSLHLKLNYINDWLASTQKSGGSRAYRNTSTSSSKHFKSHTQLKQWQLIKIPKHCFYCASPSHLVTTCPMPGDIN